MQKLVFLGIPVEPPVGPLKATDAAESHPDISIDLPHAELLRDGPGATIGPSASTRRTDCYLGDSTGDTFHRVLGKLIFTYVCGFLGYL